MTSTSEYIVTVPRAEQERSKRIRLFPSGRLVDPFLIAVEDIEIEDVAHHLAIINRYTGGCPFPVPVAQHSVWMARRCGGSAIRRLAHLMHDGGEYVWNDFASPVKWRFPEYVAGIERTEKIIFERYNIPWELMAETKYWDDKAFEFEVKSFYTPGELHPSDVIQEQTWRWAEREFLAEFHAIERAMQLEEEQARKLAWVAEQAAEAM